jgi:hypothetical protein
MNRLLDLFFISISSAIVAILFALFYSFLLMFPIQWLWNSILVGESSILGGSGFHQITFWEAFQLCVLTSLLFKPHSSSTK